MVPERHRAVVATAASAGRRWGEVAGLRADAIDLDTARIHVLRTVIEINGNTAFKPWPQSAAGRRTIPRPARWFGRVCSGAVDRVGGREFVARWTDGTGTKDEATFATYARAVSEVARKVTTTLDLYARRTDNSERILRALDDPGEEDPPPAPAPV